MYKLEENVASKNTEIKPMSETNVGANPITETEIKPMFETIVGANLMFALLQKPKSNLCSIALHCFLDIGSFLVLVRRANIRFAPT